MAKSSRSWRAWRPRLSMACCWTRGVAGCERAGRGRASCSRARQNTRIVGVHHPSICPPTPACSNYGATAVQLAAPGKRILSTWFKPQLDGQPYNVLNGTSMAAAFVSGVRAPLPSPAALGTTCRGTPWRSSLLGACRLLSARRNSSAHAGSRQGACERVRPAERADGHVGTIASPAGACRRRARVPACLPACDTHGCWARASCSGRVRASRVVAAPIAVTRSPCPRPRRTWSPATARSTWLQLCAASPSPSSASP